MSPGKVRLLQRGRCIPAMIGEDAPEPPLHLPFIEDGGIPAYARPQPDDDDEIREYRQALGEWHDAEVEKHSAISYEAEVKAEKRKQKLQIHARDEAQTEYLREKADRQFDEPAAPYSLVEELAKPDEPLTSRIDGLSFVGSRVTIAARAKTGKTTLEINLAKSLADGTPFLGGLAVTPPTGRIGVVNYEMSSTQLNTWFREANIQRPERIVPLHLQGRMMPLVSPKTQEWFIKWAKEREIEVLIMDPWSKMMVGCGSENSNDDVSAVTAILDHIKAEAGIQDLFVIAHMGHADHDDGSERARGASAFMGWPDAMWHLNRSGDIRLLQAEGRDISFESQELKWDSVTKTMSLTGLKATKSQINTKKGADEVVQIVTNLPGLKTADLKLKITSTSNAGERAAAIDEAIKSGRIYRVDGSNNAKLHYPGPDPALSGISLSDPSIQGFLSNAQPRQSGV